MILVYSGMLKSDEAAQTVAFDLTVPLGIAIALFAAYSILFSKTAMNLRHLTGSMWAYVLFLIVTIGSSWWSPSSVYLQSKLFLLATISQIFVVAGWLIFSRVERLRRFLIVNVVFGVVLSISFLSTRGLVIVPSGDAVGDFSFMSGGYQSWSPLQAMSLMSALLLLSFESGISQLKRWCLLASVPLFSLLMLASGGRGGLLAVLVGGASLVTLKVFRSRRALALPTLALMTGTLWVLQPTITDFIADLPWERLPDTLRRVVISAAITDRVEDRTDLVSQGIAVWMENPIWGGGLASWPVISGYGDYRQYPHNLIIELLAETGVVGAALFCVCVFLALRSAFHRWSGRNEGQASVVLTLFAASVAMSMVSSDLNGNRWLFLSLGAMLAPSIQLPGQQSPSSSSQPTTR